MCGILGFVSTSSANLGSEVVEPIVTRLLILSEWRGKESSGLAIRRDSAIDVYKRPTSARKMTRTAQYKELLRQQDPNAPWALIGHARLVTNGGMALNENNQPVIAGGVVGVHNGIVTNVDSLWSEFSSLTREAEVDTEIIFQLLRHFYDEHHCLIRAVRQVFRTIKGVANIAVFMEDTRKLILATNNGSLYGCSDTSGSTFLFMSERSLLEELVEKTHLAQTLGPLTISRIEPGQACLLDLDTLEREDFSLDADDDHSNTIVEPVTPVEIRAIAGPETDMSEWTVLAPTAGAKAPKWFIEEYERNAEAISRIPRCKSCTHPATLPFSDFDENGVCAYCRHHEPLVFKGPDALKAMVEPHRRKDGRPDCIVPLSGGRDSCYALHYMAAELGMKPIAYTYDWGMVTDLARRNCSRLCGKLGVEHVIVSADLAQKRRFIRKNVEAWLRRPSLGTIPLFMAGDKQFFYYAERVKQKNDVDLLMFSMNPLERTDFKHGFCGISGGGHKGSFFRLNAFKSFQIAMYYGKEFLLNPAYLNSSVADTLFAYFAYFVMPHNFSWFYEYIGWEENLVSNTIIDEYDWELSPDTKTTWRIGDGTASFYNYIYWTVAGFSENDTFRSYQIREGQMSREEAMKNVLIDNVPRYDSMAWYCETIGVDLEACLRKIHEIPKLYEV